MKSFRSLFTAACLAFVALSALVLPSSAFAAAGVTADVSGMVQGTYAGANDLGSVIFSVQQKALNRLSPGTAAGQADKIYSKTRTITASSTENLDLAGVLPDPFGVTLTFVKVKAVYVAAAAGNTNDVCFGGAASNTFAFLADVTDVVCVKPGGFALITNPVGWTVTAATGDLLKVANSGSGTSVTYSVIIIGTSA